MKNIIKLTPTKAIIQILDATETISLDTDLLFTGVVQSGFIPQTVSGTPTVNITGVRYSLPASSPSTNPTTITRNGVKVLNLNGSQNHEFQYSIISNNTSNIVVNCPSGGMVFLELNKIAGYSDVIPNVGA